MENEPIKEVRKDTFKIPLYGGYFTVYVGPSVVNMRTSRSNIEDFGPYADDNLSVAALCSASDTTLKYALFFTPDVSINSIFHEVFHLVALILGRAGLKLEASSVEAFAYLQGYLGNIVYNFVRDNVFCVD